MEGNTQKSIIRIERKAQFVCSLLKFKIYIDKKLAGRISTGEILEFNIELGSHEVYIKLDWCRSKKN